MSDYVLDWLKEGPKLDLPSSVKVTESDIRRLIRHPNFKAGELYTLSDIKSILDIKSDHRAKNALELLSISSFFFLAHGKVPIIKITQGGAKFVDWISKEDALKKLHEFLIDAQIQEKLEERIPVESRSEKIKVSVRDDIKRDIETRKNV